MRPTFAIAPNFQMTGGWQERLLLPEAAGWRGPLDAEVAAFAPQAADAQTNLMFTLPAHLRQRFWAMLSEQAAEGTGDFIAFADDMRQLLDFKMLKLPADAAFELVLQDPRGEVDGTGLWALANFGEEAVLLEWPGVRLRLAPGEGCRFAGALPHIVPPEGEEDPNVLVAIRTGAETLPSQN